MRFSRGLGYCSKCGNYEDPWTFINGEWIYNDCYEANYGYNIEDDLKTEEWLEESKEIHRALMAKEIK